MKIKQDFVLRQIAENWVVLPLAEETVNFNGMLTLNDSGAMLWRKLEAGADEKTLVDALMDAYQVSLETALADVQEFLEILRGAGCLEQD